MSKLVALLLIRTLLSLRRLLALRKGITVLALKNTISINKFYPKYFLPEYTTYFVFYCAEFFEE